MANQNNYQTLLAVAEENYIKYTVSRIVSSPTNKLIETELPTNIPENFILDISLYSLADNSLIYSAVFPKDDDALEVRNLMYPDGSVRRMLFINFFKLKDLIDIDGTYQMVINFFVEEIGKHNSMSLAITEISPTRKEIEVQLLPQYRNQEEIKKLVTFATPSISSVWVLEALKYICNQTGSLNQNIPTEKTTLSYNLMTQYLPPDQSTKLKNPEVPGLYTASIQQTTQRILNMTYNYASESIRLNYASESLFTNKMMKDIFSSSLGRAMSQQIKENDLFRFV